MTPLLVLIRKDIAHFLRNRTALVLTFIVPITLIYIFGQVWGLNRKTQGPSGVRLAVVNESTHPAAGKLVEALRREPAFRVRSGTKQPDGSERPLTAAEARALIESNELRFAVVIPADVVGTDKVGVNLRILSNPQNSIETQMVNGLLQKTLVSHVPQLIGASLQEGAKRVVGAERLERFNQSIAASVAGTFGGDAKEIEKRMAAGYLGFGGDASGESKSGEGSKSRAADALSRLIRIDQEQVVGRQVKSPQATTIIGGQAMMFLLFALSSSAAAFFDEKNSGIFQRLLAAPITRGHILWSRFVFGVLMGVVQLLTLFTAGRVLYGVDVFGHFGSLLVVCTAAAAACTAFAMFIAAVSPDAKSASGLATLLVLTMSALGGAWFPMSLMPEFMQTIGKFTIVYWSMEGFTRVLWAGKTALEILPVLGILVAISVGVMAIAVYRLNRRSIFG